MKSQLACAGRASGGIIQPEITNNEVTIGVRWITATSDKVRLGKSKHTDVGMFHRY
jgi:hypothetical protein